MTLTKEEMGLKKSFLFFFLCSSILRFSVEEKRSVTPFPCSSLFYFLASPLNTMQEREREKNSYISGEIPFLALGIREKVRKTKLGKPCVLNGLLDLVA